MPFDPPGDAPYDLPGADDGRPCVACSVCGKPATCVGQYESAESPSPACDDCCGHGCEDGHCDPIDYADEVFAIQQTARLKWALNATPTDEVCCVECSYPDGLCSCRTFQPPATETP